MGILHRDISFRNVRVDKKNEVHVCDFDMATDVDSTPSGAQERTGTVAFIAASLLKRSANYHCSLHDCESVFWICAFSLLKSTVIGHFYDLIRQIFSASTELAHIASAKVDLLDTLRRSKRELYKHRENIEVNPMIQETQISMYYCLADLSRILDENNYSQGYVGARGFQEDCFITLATAIKDAFLLDEDKVTSGVGEMSV
jgi:hypothetical protein